MTLNAETQHILASDSFHFYGSNIHVESKNYILGNEKLTGQWLKLSESIEVNDIEDEMFMILLLDLYSDVCKYYLKISLTAALKTFKESVARKKKQALRTKLQVLESKGSKGKWICKLLMKVTFTHARNVKQYLRKNLPALKNKV